MVGSPSGVLEPVSLVHGDEVGDKEETEERRRGGVR
jgi:hypothetical protein